MNYDKERASINGGTTTMEMRWTYISEERRQTSLSDHGRIGEPAHEAWSLTRGADGLQRLLGFRA